MRRSVEIKLSGAERSELERLARGRRVWRSLSDRAHIVLLAAEGPTNVQVANALGINSHTDRKWRNRFAEQRMDGLEDETRSGRPRCINDDAVAEVIRKTLEETPRDATHWSTRSMARATSYAPSTRVCPIICVSGAMGVALSGLSALRPESDLRTGLQTAPSRRSKQRVASSACRRCGSPGTRASSPPRRWGSCPAS